MNTNRRELIRFAALVALCLVLFVFHLGARDIWDIDEGMHSAMAQTMLLTGDWVTPVFNGEPFFDKPVLFNWLNATAFLIFGISEFAARLPSALAGLACVIVTYLFGRKMYDAGTGLLAAVILATSLEVLVLSRVVQYDMLFALLITLALYLFAMGVVETRHRKSFFLGFYAAAALAILAKGPLGLLLPGMVIGTYLLIERRLGLLREIQLPAGLLIVALIVAPWFALMEQANPGYLDYFIFKQHFGNFLGGEGALAPRHPEPLYYYLPVLLGGLLPWSLMLPQAMARGLREDRRAGRGLSLYLVIWAIGIFLFFTLATSKLSTYLLPMFPAAALLLGRYWRQFLDEPGDASRRALLITLGGMFVLLSLLTVYVIAEKPWTYWKFRTGIEWRDFEIFMVTLSALFAASCLLIWMRRMLAGLVALSVISPFMIFYILFVMAPGVDPYKGAQSIGLQLSDRLPPGQRFRFYGQLLDSAMFYADRGAVILHDEAALEDYLASGERVFVLVRSRARTAEDAFTGNYHVISVTGNKAIVSNRPGPL